MEQIIKIVHNHLAPEIKAMNELMVQNLNVEEELVSVVGNYLSRSGGKRIRPVLTLLCAKLFGYNGMDHLRLAAAVEFIHMATLLHDDVVDGSKMRRFLPTANTVWGSKASILVGDFLFSQSFKLIVSTKSLEALEVLSSSSAIIAQGEVTQLAKLEENRIINENEYIKIIKAKTAELFASSAEVGAIIAGVNKELSLLIRKFADNLGVIFQITDDLLDYYSDPVKAGKNTGDDLLEGKVTLPLIIAFDRSTSQEKLDLEAIIKKSSRDMDDFNFALLLIEKYKVKSEIAIRIEPFKTEALSVIDYLSGKDVVADKAILEYLKGLLEFACSRGY